MNKEWSELNKQIQTEIKKESTFKDGINTLITLRKDLMDTMISFREMLSDEQFSAIPFINAKGYHSKTIAYSLFHVFRIEDITSNSLIRKDEQIFIRDNYKERMKSSIITTGNELVKQEIADFSAALSVDELYNYIRSVDESTTDLLHSLSYNDTKTGMTEQDKKNLHLSGTVSEDENAVWLIDYWRSKNIQGLIKMPFSRHWIMHIEACMRIINKLGVIDK